MLLTPGEPAGIGPELAIRAVAARPGPVLIADPGLLERCRNRLGLDLELVEYEPANPVAPETLPYIPVPLAATEQPGRLNPANAAYVLECLRRACKQCLAGHAAGLVTGPVHKGLINRAGIPFSGHTEFLAEQAHVDRVVMMLTAGDLRVALATTHLPLARVSQAITRPDLTRTLEILDADLKSRFGLDAPCIAVLGLNPHAGEDGHLGSEEIETITPVIETLKAGGMNLVGPLPADTAFVPATLKRFDTVLAMYHDQGLPVLKHAGFGHAVNITLGLPFVRTSVDHGTALDLAGTGRADPGSLAAAIDLAKVMTGTADERR